MALQAIWIKQVQRTRADWTGPTSTQSILCSKPFTKNCFEMDTDIEAGFRIKTRRRLGEGAIPTIFIRLATSASSQPLEDCSSSLKQTVSFHHGGNESQKKRRTFEKRESSCKCPFMWLSRA